MISSAYTYRRERKGRYDRLIMARSGKKEAKIIQDQKISKLGLSVE